MAHRVTCFDRIERQLSPHLWTFFCMFYASFWVMLTCLFDPMQGS